MTRNLLRNERIVFKTRVHLMAVVSKLVWTVVGLLMLASPVFYLFLQVGSGSEAMAGAGALACLAAVGLGLHVTLTFGFAIPKALSDWLCASATVTNKRVIVRSGMFIRRSFELPYHQIEGVFVEQSLFGMLLGYGDVVVTGTGGTHERFSHICGAGKLQQSVHDQIDNDREPFDPPMTVRHGSTGCSARR